MPSARQLALGIFVPSLGRIFRIMVELYLIEALDDLLPLVYEELRRQASNYLRPRTARPHVANHGADS